MKLTFPLLNTTINVPVDEAMAGGKKSRRELRRKKQEGKLSEQIEKTEELTTPVGEKSIEDKPVESPQVVQSEQLAEPSLADKDSTQPLLMAEVVNVTHEKFKQTEEIKVC